MYCRRRNRNDCFTVYYYCYYKRRMTHCRKWCRVKDPHCARSHQLLLPQHLSEGSMTWPLTAQTVAHSLSLDCAVGTTDRFLSSVSLFMCVESNSGVADPGAAAARPGTRVVEWLCAELPDCSSMFESWQTRVIELSSCFVTQGTPGGAIEWGTAQVRSVDFAPFHVTLDDVFKPSDRPVLWTFSRSQLHAHTHTHSPVQTVTFTAAVSMRQQTHVVVTSLVGSPHHWECGRRWW